MTRGALAPLAWPPSQASAFALSFRALLSRDRPVFSPAATYRPGGTFVLSMAAPRPSSRNPLATGSGVGSRPHPDRQVVGLPTRVSWFARPIVSRVAGRLRAGPLGLADCRAGCPSLVPKLCHFCGKTGKYAESLRIAVLARTCKPWIPETAKPTHILQNPHNANAGALLRRIR